MTAGTCSGAEARRSGAKSRHNHDQSPGHLGFDHAALLYHSDREYVDALMRFITEGFDEAQPMLVALPGDKLELLGAAVNGTAPNVTVLDMTEVGRNPGRILAAGFAFIEAQRHQCVRIIAEPVWPGRTADEHRACVQHEALANIAFADCDVTSLCPYDASCLEESVLAGARLTHPLIWEHGEQQRNPDYSVEAALDQGNEPLVTTRSRSLTPSASRRIWLAPAATPPGMLDCSACRPSASATYNSS